VEKIVLDAPPNSVIPSTSVAAKQLPYILASLRQPTSCNGERITFLGTVDVLALPKVLEDLIEAKLRVINREPGICVTNGEPLAEVLRLGILDFLRMRPEGTDLAIVDRLRSVTGRPARWSVR
jgi:hypothetical protein